MPIDLMISGPRHDDRGPRFLYLSHEDFIATKLAARKLT